MELKVRKNQKEDQKRKNQKEDQKEDQKENPYFKTKNKIDITYFNL